MAIWLPPKAIREHVEERRAYEQELLAKVEVNSSMDHWNRELRAIDEHLQLIFAPESAHVAGITPGRYHVLRTAPGVPPSLFAVTGPNGEFVEPTSQMLEKLRESDLWNEVAGRERAKKERLMAEAKERARVREREDIAEEFRDRFKAKENPGVSFAKTGPWRYRAGARRAA
jgi:hypothetical protein